MIVVDTNVISYLLLPGPLKPMAQQAVRKAPWSAPLLWRSEFRNVLSLYMRHHALPLQAALDLMGVAESLLRKREFAVQTDKVLECVSQSRRSAYDCEFVALAMELRVPLVTTDEPVIKDFPKVAIHLRNYVQ